MEAFGDAIRYRKKEGIFHRYLKSSTRQSANFFDKDVLPYNVARNAAWLLSEGRMEAEAKAYLMRYAFMDDETAGRELASLQRPLRNTYIFTYFYGHKLLEPILRGPECREHLLVAQNG